MKRHNGLFVILFVAVLSLGGPGSVAAQSPRKSEIDDTTKQLLDEVRALRQALQTIQRMSMDT
jgi:hypothetical protein